MSIALPQELDFSIASSLPNNRSYEVRVQPSNGATFNTQGSVIQVSLPLLQRSFYESDTMYLTGRLTASVAVAASTTTNTCYCSPAGIYSAFSRITVRSANGNVLDDITNPGQVANVLLKAGLTTAERASCANTMLLSERADNINLGMAFNIENAPGQGVVLDWVFPMLGMLNMTRYLPAYGSELIIELTLNSAVAFAPVALGVGNSVTAISLTNIELVSQVLEFSPDAFTMVQQRNPEKIVLKSETYSFGSTTIPGSSQGTFDIPFSIRCSSLKKVIVICSPATVAEGVGYGSVNPNANSISFISNGTTFPNRPVQTSRPAEVFAQFQKAFGGLYSSDKSSQIPISGWRRASTAYVPGIYGAFNSTVTATALAASPNSWYFVLDLEALSADKQNLYNGLSTQGTSSNNIRIDIGTALAATPHTIAYFSCHDILLNMDLVSGIVSSVT